MNQRINRLVILYISLIYIKELFLRTFIVSFIIYLRNKDAHNIYLHVAHVFDTYSQNGVIYWIRVQ